MNVSDDSSLRAPDDGGALARLLLPIDEGALRCSSGRVSEWLQADGWRVLAAPAEDPSPRGDEIARFETKGGSSLAAVQGPNGEISIPFNPEEAYTNFVTERWTAHERRRGFSQQTLSGYYRMKRFIPRSAQLALRRLVVRRQGLPDFPRWPLETSTIDLLRFYARCIALSARRHSMQFEWFWPNGASAALVLTHDVESAEGLRLAIDVADLEEERGFRSSFNIVGSWYRLDWGVIGELRSRGFELGVHGLFHDRSLFESRHSFERQLPALEEFARTLGANGFRSPATHRVHMWLGELPVDYDCTVPHSDPFEHQPGGCCTIWPFFIGPLVELPYTMPQDHTLFNLLRRKSADIWLEQARRLEEAHGLIQLVTHPDP